MNAAAALNHVARLPVVGPILRRLARIYPEGSVVRIRTGCLAGCRWRRSHRYVSSYWLGTHEPLVQACLVRELKPGDVFYDVGANAGFFSLLAAQCVGERGRVFAFEPLPENIETLHEQFRLNACRNSEVVAMAVSNCTGSTTLECGPDRSTAHLAKALTGGICGCPVQTVTLDEFIETHARPDLIKIDVEGAEVMLLQGALHLLSGTGRPTLLIEFHGPELAQAGYEILASCGYRLFRLNGDACARGNCFWGHVLAVPASV